MFKRRKAGFAMGALGAVMALGPPCVLAAKKTHAVVMGSTRKVSYSQAGDPAGALPGEDTLKVRPLVVDGSVKEWTTGEMHSVTDRSFVVRRALRLNDDLPGAPASAQGHWVWQRGPWLLVDRVTGHVSALKLPDYEPGVSRVSWFRDYGAYCGITASGKSLYAVVAQLAARKPILARKLEAFGPDLRGHAGPVCEEPIWQREPLRVTFQPAGMDAMIYDVVPGSAVLVEESQDEAESNLAGGKPD